MRYLVLAGLWLYRKFLTRYTPACPEQECCSAYAVRMVKEHGATIGLEMALEKVRNCGQARDTEAGILSVLQKDGVESKR